MLSFAIHAKYNPDYYANVHLLRISFCRQNSYDYKTFTNTDKMRFCRFLWAYRSG